MSKSKSAQSTREQGSPRGGLLRLISTGIIIIAEVFLLYLITSQLSIGGYALFTGIGFITTLRLQMRDDNPSYKMAWTFVLLMLPGLGLGLYWLWGSTRLSDDHPIIRRMREFDLPRFTRDDAASAALKNALPEYYTMSRYLKHTANAAVYQNTWAKYFESGEAKFEALIRDLKSAQRFIFLEYFIIAEGEIWDSVHDILREKAASGVEVKLMYDDFGSLFKIGDDFKLQLQFEGIEVACFNPINRRPTRMILNYRNHQKIVVIDGNIGYTGGINLGDEYANIEAVFGHWKDTALRLQGSAVWGLTLTFLTMWQVSTGAMDTNDIDRYRPAKIAVFDDGGFYQPFADGPANNPLNPASGIYKRMIYAAKESVTITSPYLILDNEMIDALVSAAESGVNVRIITPFIPDKPYVQVTSRSFYGRLLRGGVKIYEYTPGFIHAKMVLVDNASAIVGTINMDFRSFYLHYENAVWMANTPAVNDIAQDINKTLAQCQQIDYEEWLLRPWYIKAVQVVLNLFTPLM